MYLIRKEQGKPPSKPQWVEHTDHKPPHRWFWEPHNGYGDRITSRSHGVSVIALTAGEAMHLVSGL